jgi:hypothetical protein
MSDSIHQRRNQPWAWTEQEDERLRAYVAQGASVVKVAAVLKRNIISVRTHARALGCPFPPLRVVRQKWAGYSGQRLTPRRGPRRSAVAAPPECLVGDSRSEFAS